LSEGVGSGRPDQMIGSRTDVVMAPASLPCPSALPQDVLIVEDDPMIALDLEETILGFGVPAVRTAANVIRALDMIAERAPDFALLDVGLIRENSFAIAERLAALDIPFAFVTGYGAAVGLPPAFADRPRLPKPCPSEALAGALTLGKGRCLI
jgi:CheY-like chemotaxis protein